MWILRNWNNAPRVTFYFLCCKYVFNSGKYLCLRFGNWRVHLKICELLLKLGSFILNHCQTLQVIQLSFLKLTLYWVQLNFVLLLELFTSFMIAMLRVAEATQLLQPGRSTALTAVRSSGTLNWIRLHVKRHTARGSSFSHIIKSIVLKNLYTKESVKMWIYSLDFKSNTTWSWQVMCSPSCV